MSMKVRLLDMGMVSPLRSQSIYHGITATMTPGADPAILLCRPKSTYVSIGYFQEAGMEVDLAFCDENNIPVYTVNSCWFHNCFLRRIFFWSSWPKNCYRTWPK